MLAQSAGLNFDVAVGAVVGAVEHALEFKLLNIVLEVFNFLGHEFGAVEVFVGDRHVEKFPSVRDAGTQTIEVSDEVFKRFLFFADFLCAFGIVPKCRVFNLAVDFF